MMLAGKEIRKQRLLLHTSYYVGTFTCLLLSSKLKLLFLGYVFSSAEKKKKSEREKEMGQQPLRRREKERKRMSELL